MPSLVLTSSHPLFSATCFAASNTAAGTLGQDLCEG